MNDDLYKNFASPLLSLQQINKNSDSKNSSISEHIISQKEKIDLFEKFNGSMKVLKDFNEKEELLKYLDERYN